MSRIGVVNRTRIITAISQVTVIAETGYRSGSLNTAEMASQLGRAVAAVPGPVTGAASAECHKLISDGTAKLVCNPEDVGMLHPNPAQ